MSVEIYTFKVTESLSEKERENFLALVSDEKKEKISRQKSQIKANTMLMGEILAKKAISNKYGIDIRKITFSLTENGKPYIPERDDIHFNISHSGDYVALALSDKPVGIDIEMIKPVNKTLAKKILNEEEFLVFEASEDKDSEFIKFWTMKEAVIKLHGEKIASLDIRNCITDEIIESEKLGNYWVSVAEIKK